MTRLDIVLESNKPCYSCGDELHGKCILTISESLKFQTFYMELEGGSYAHWTKQRNRKTVHYSSKVPYMQLKQIFLLSNDANDNQPITLIAGVHQYQFSFQIPNGELPSSFQSSIGHIRYWLKAEVVRNWAPNVKTVLDVAMYNPPIYDPNERPLEVWREKILCCGCCQSDPITARLILNKTAFQIGENILISATFCNPTSREMAPKVRLISRIIYSARGAHKRDEIILNKITDQLLTEDNLIVWEDKELLIPQTVNSINNCENIKLEHFVKLTLVIPGSLYVDIEYPIVIGLPALNSIPLNNLAYPPSIPLNNLAYPPSIPLRNLAYPHCNTNQPQQPHPNIKHEPHSPGFIYDSNVIATLDKQPKSTSPFNTLFDEQNTPETTHLPSYQEYTSNTTENVRKE